MSSLYGIGAALFFTSGAVGLAYEVTWFRWLQLILGVSVFAAGAVASAFMLGLALGSRWASRSERLARNPLQAYAILEVGIATYAAAFPLIVQLLEAAYAAIYGSLEGSRLALTLMRFVLAAGALIPPTALMGATLPVVSQALVRGRRRSARIGVLYAINTLGGAAGTLLTGFFALEHLGIRGTLALAVGVNLAVAAVALLLSRSERSRATAPGPRRDAAPAVTRLPILVMWTAGIAGFSSMALEIVWTRALLFYVHNSTYAFSAILATYLIGLGGGALLGSAIARRTVRPATWTAWILIGVSVSTLLSILFYRQLPEITEPILGGRLAKGLSGFRDPGVWIVGSWTRALVGVFAQTSVVLLHPAMLFGMIFPLLLRLGKGEERRGEERRGHPLPLWWDRCMQPTPSAVWLERPSGPSRW